MSGQTHTADARVLNRRTLENDHKRLAAILRPGVSVLDAGCGTGAITAGIARVCGPSGRVVGMDRDAGLLAQARAAHVAPNLSFVQGDVLTMTEREAFDVVNAARLLQWIATPGEAVKRMAAAARRGGMVVALDYNHADNRLEPEGPAEFRRFYDAFLAWRAGHGWDNRMGDHLAELFTEAGLRDVAVSVEDEISRESIWPHVMESLGPKMVAEGALREAERVAALAVMREFDGVQWLALRAVTGVRAE